LRPGILARSRIPRLQLAKVGSTRTRRQADILGLGPEPKLAGNQRHFLAGEAAAEILVGRDVDQSGFLTIRRRRPILATPQGWAELNPLANNRLVSRVDNRLTTLGLNAFPDIGMNKRPAGHIFDAVRPALQDPENRVPSRMDKTLDRS